MKSSGLYSFIFCLFSLSMTLAAQQIADINYRTPDFKPDYKPDEGPLVIIDEAHNNFHTASGRYTSFADLLIKDGFKVKGGKQNFTNESLSEVKVLVIANAIHNDNLSVWSLPTPSAFTADEINTVNKWVKEGGSLFLIADHMPFAGAASDLAGSFGFKFYNGFAVDTTVNNSLDIFTRNDHTLRANEITNGVNSEYKVDTVATFTGQAFDIPESALPILIFNDRYKVLMPSQAWKFDADTPGLEAKGKSQGAYMKYGKGRLVVFGEAAMFTAQLANGKKVGMNAPHAKYNYRLILNIMKWLTAG